MKGTLSFALLAQLSGLIAEQVGLNFPEQRWSDLERGITAAAAEFGFKEDVGACARWLLAEPLTQYQIEILAGELTIGETYFFRESQTLESFEQQILPHLLHARRGDSQHLRIWSAGCCTGEEPYTLAILLHKLLPDLAEWRITILGTDVNTQFLKKATQGVYREWSFRRTPPEIKLRYFRQTSKETYEILPEIKRMVTFSYLNLIENNYPSLLTNTTMLDIIFCRNVLMYFAPDTIRMIAHRFYRCLLDGGWFVVSPTETSPLLYAHFTTVNFPGAILYRKEEKRPVLNLNGPAPDFAPLIPQLPSPKGHQGADLLPQESSRATTTTHITGDENVGHVKNVTSSRETPASRYKRDLRQDEKLFSEEPVTLPQTPHEKAAALYEQGQYEAVAKELENLFAPDHHLNPAELPAEEKAILMLIRVHANQGRLVEAQAWCEKAIAQNKLNPIYHYLLATILQEQGQPGPAIQALRRTLYLEPNFVLAHFAMGNLARQQGNQAEANRRFDTALALLQTWDHEALVPESEGLTAGRLKEIISLLRRGR